jgi:fibronectin-binding autotransporter adhesin
MRTVYVGVTNGSGTFDGVISSGSLLALNKMGTGTQILTSNHTYTGATTVSGGTLIVNGVLSAFSAVTVQTNATLGGLGTVGGSVTVQNGGRVAPGGSVVGGLTTGAQTWNAGSVVVCKLAGVTDDSASRDYLTINGTLNLSQLGNGNVATLKLVSMLGGGTPGNIPGFDPAGNYTWTIGSATGLNPLDPNVVTNVVLDTSAVSNSHPGTFSLAVNLFSSPPSLELHYTGTAPQPPVVMVTSPADGAYTNAPGNVPLAVSVAPNGHTVASVTYYTNGVPATGAITDPYSTSLSGLAAGRYDISAVALYDTTQSVNGQNTNTFHVLGPIQITSRGKVAGGNFQLGFTGPAGQPFSVKGTNAVNAPFAQWPVLSSGTIGAGGSVTFTDTNAPANSRQFYRIISP